MWGKWFYVISSDENLNFHMWEYTCNPNKAWIKLLPENVREMSEGFSSIPENNKDALLFNTILKITIYFADRKA